MKPVDDSPGARIRTAEEFYDNIAPQYDAMSGFERRFEKERPVFRALVERYRIKRALDAGCGSGFHSILLSQLDVDVTALDISSEMVRLAKDNARMYQADIKVIKGGFQDTPPEWRESFDAVFVMGNSLPHLLSRNELRQALASLSDVLSSKGLLFVQVLNYAKILARQEHVLNSREINGTTITRVYDYKADDILFSVVTQSAGTLSEAEKRETVRLRPVLSEELRDIFREIGTRSVEFFGNMLLEPFEPLTSADLIAVAEKR